MNHKRSNTRALAVGLWLGSFAAAGAFGAAEAPAGVTVFQQGVSPTPEYAGCVDTFMVASGWAHDRPSSRPRQETLGGRALMRFDVSAIDKDRMVRRAILRLWCPGIPPSRQEPLEAYGLAREWDVTATWYEHKYLDAAKTEANDWTSPGGDLYTAWASGGKPGLVAGAAVRGGPFGHVYELDLTALVRQWVSGNRPNHGVCLFPPRGGFSVASADWPIAPYRPMLLVEHHAKGEKPKAGVQLTLPRAAGANARLSPLAGAPSLGKDEWTTVRFGRNANCQHRSGHFAGYLKSDPRFPGEWDWTPRLRVGGTAGDFNHALFKFDLSALPEGAKVDKATLKAWVDLGNLRLPTDALYQPPKPNERDERWRLGYVRNRMGELMKYSFGCFAVVSKTIPPGAVRAVIRDRGVAVHDSPASVCHVGKQWEKASAERGKMPQTWLAWDVTGLVRAWVSGKLPNEGVIVDHSLMGGEMVLMSDDWFEPDLRPYLELELSPAPPAAPAPPTEEPLLPSGDYWLEPARAARAKWKGTSGTFAQYGDSISITRAFWTPMQYGEFKGIAPEMQTALEAARQYVHKPCWRDWKGGDWGNTGNMTINWAFRNIDAWQKKMNPQVAVILFGTNDAGSGPRPPHYTEQYAAVIDRMLADGTIPIITTLPPRGSQRGGLSGLLTVLDLRRAAIAVAKAKKVPLIDLYTEMVRRQPENWPKILVPDGLHPSYPAQHRRDWSEEGLKHSGYDLRNYLTLKAWYEIYEKILKQ